MKPTADYANAQAFTGEFETLTTGGHIVQIRAARCEVSRSGKDMLVIAFDIAEGSEFDGFYKRRFARMKGMNPDAKWPGVYYAVTTNNEGGTNPMFKGLITCIEESNDGYKWNWLENSLNGKFVGFNFGEEEYEDKRTGEIKTNVKPMFPATIARVREGITSPAIKRTAPSKPNAFAQAQSGAFSQVSDDELPF